MSFFSLPLNLEPFWALIQIEKLSYFWRLREESTSKTTSIEKTEEPIVEEEDENEEDYLGEMEGSEEDDLDSFRLATETGEEEISESTEAGSRGSREEKVGQRLKSVKEMSFPDTVKITNHESSVLSAN